MNYTYRIITKNNQEVGTLPQDRKFLNSHNWLNFQKGDMLWGSSDILDYDFKILVIFHNKKKVILCKA